MKIKMGSRERPDRNILIKKIAVEWYVNKTTVIMMRIIET
jgi:hypothetical protein